MLNRTTPVPSADTLRRALAPGPWLTLQCVRCFQPYKTQRLSVRLCPACAAGGADPNIVGEVSGT